MPKNYSTCFFCTKFDGKVSDWPRKKPIDFEGKPEPQRVTLWLGVRVRLEPLLGGWGHCHILRTGGCVLAGVTLFNSDTLAISGILVSNCSLLRSKMGTYITNARRTRNDNTGRYSHKPKTTTRSTRRVQPPQT